MRQLTVSLQLGRAGKHHGAVHTGIRVELQLRAVGKIAARQVCDHSQLQLCHHGVRVEFLHSLDVDSSYGRVHTDNLTGIIDRLLLGFTDNVAGACTGLIILEHILSGQILLRNYQIFSHFQIPLLPAADDGLLLRFRSVLRAAGLSLPLVLERSYGDSRSDGFVLQSQWDSLQLFDVRKDKSEDNSVLAALPDFLASMMSSEPNEGFQLGPAC